MQERGSKLAGLVKLLFGQSKGGMGSVSELGFGPKLGQSNWYSKWAKNWAVGFGSDEIKKQK